MPLRHRAGRSPGRGTASVPKPDGRCPISRGRATVGKSFGAMASSARRPPNRHISCADYAWESSCEMRAGPR